jgi:hypothetical protein
METAIGYGVGEFIVYQKLLPGRIALIPSAPQRVLPISVPQFAQIFGLVLNNTGKPRRALARR